MLLFTAFTMFTVLLVIGFTWYFINYFANPVLENPDGIAKVVGNCGDTMEIGLKFKDGRVENTHHWTDGCSFSQHCVETTVKLARKKTIAELKNITMMTIMEEVGQLPETHMHCAQLAEITLHQSVENYLDQQNQAAVYDTKS